MDFQAAASDRDRAKSLSGVVAARLSENRGLRVVAYDEVAAELALQKEKLKLGCSDESCLRDVSSALGARYIVHGRLDRFGSTTVLNAFLFDSQAGNGVLRFSESVHDDAFLVGEAEKFAAQVVSALTGVAPAEFVPSVSFNLKFGNTFASLRGASLNAFNARFDVEGDYYFSPRWQGFLLAGLQLGNATAADGTAQQSFRLFSPFVGAKYTFRVQEELRPYLGVGLGFGVINRLFNKSDASTVSVNTQAMLGLAYVPFKHVGFNVETAANLSGVSSQGDGVYFGFTTNFGVLALF